MAKPKLTRLQRRVAELVVAGAKPTQAVRDLQPRYKRPDVQASKIMALPQVQEYVAKLEEEALREARVTHIGILKDLVSVKNRCMQAEPVLDDDGKPTGKYQFRENGAIKSLELLGRYRRMWGEDRQQPQLPIGPGLTVIIQQGVQVHGQHAVQTHRVDVNLPRPG